MRIYAYQNSIVSEKKSDLLLTKNEVDYARTPL